MNKKAVLITAYGSVITAYGSVITAYGSVITAYGSVFFWFIIQQTLSLQSYYFSIFSLKPIS